MTTVWYFTRSNTVYYFRTHRDALLARITGDSAIMERQVVIN